MFYYYKELTEYRGYDAPSTPKFLHGFEARLSELMAFENLTLPDNLRATMMINYAKLPVQQENNLFGACEGKLNPLSISRVIKLVLTEKSEKRDPAYVTDHKLDRRNDHDASHKHNFCRCCKKRGHNMSECWKLK